VCTFVQYGALAALSEENGFQDSWRTELEIKRDIAYTNACRLFKCVKPQGAFYVFPDVSRRLKAGATTLDFVSDLLQKTGVAVVPGEAFGMAGHIRISFAVSEHVLEQGFEKIADIL
jgi:aspartate aminotransferase